MRRQLKIHNIAQMTATQTATDESIGQTPVAPSKNYSKTVSALHLLYLAFASRAFAEVHSGATTVLVDELDAG